MGDISYAFVEQNNYPSLQITFALYFLSKLPNRLNWEACLENTRPISFEQNDQLAFIAILLTFCSK